LPGDKQHCLQVKLPFAGLKQVLKGRSQKVHHHHVEMLVWHRVVSSNVVKPRHASFKWLWMILTYFCL